LHAALSKTGKDSETQFPLNQFFGKKKSGGKSSFGATIFGVPKKA
jgi:hypothetical protein